MKLGVDIGRVIISPEDEDGLADTSFLHGSNEEALRTPPYAGMFEVLPGLVKRFDAKVWLISKCGPGIQSKTLAWLEYHRFYERTGIEPRNVRFCLRRPEKAIICRKLGITHFIDDRESVLSPMRGVVPHLYLFGPQKGIKAPEGYRLTPSWADVQSAIDADLLTANERLSRNGRFPQRDR